MYHKIAPSGNLLSDDANTYPICDDTLQCIDA